MPVEGGRQPRPTRKRRCRPVKQEPAGHASTWRKHWTPRTGALTGQGDDFGHHTFTVRGGRRGSYQPSGCGDRSADDRPVLRAATQRRTPGSEASTAVAAGTATANSPKPAHSPPLLPWPRPHPTRAVTRPPASAAASQERPANSSTPPTRSQHES